MSKLIPDPVVVVVIVLLVAAGHPISASVDFIRTNCESTLYPELCYHSLAGYANAVQSDPGRLARVAVGVSLSRTKHMALYVANLTHQADYSADRRAASALHDCFSVLTDAVDQIRESLYQMRTLNLNARAQELRFQLSNVQTWMSAALTNEDTCVDGLDEINNTSIVPIKDDVSDRILKVKEVTSNALALVNIFVSKV